MKGQPRANKLEKPCYMVRIVGLTWCVYYTDRGNPDIGPRGWLIADCGEGEAGEAEAEHVARQKNAELPHVKERVDGDAARKKRIDLNRAARIAYRKKQKSASQQTRTPA